MRMIEDMKNNHCNYNYNTVFILFVIIRSKLLRRDFDRKRYLNKQIAAFHVKVPGVSVSAPLCVYGNVLFKCP